MSIELIKQIRAKTAIGVAELKKAIEEVGEDESKIMEWLRERGAEKATKKSDREIKEGKIFAYQHNDKTAAIVALGSETDFLARNEEFEAVGKELAMQVAAMNPENVEEFLEQQYIRDPSKTVNDLIIELISKVGENVVVLDFKRLSI